MRSFFAFALVLIASPAWPEPPRPHQERLRDGTELVVVTVPGASTLSLRYIVHAGGNLDTKPGLAHLLEHIIFHGTYRFGQEQLFRTVKAHGGQLNGFTTADTTQYVLDAPRREAEPLVRLMVQAITGPTITPAALEQERMVVAAEADLRIDEGLYTMMAQLLSPAFRNAGSVIGTDGSRARIERSDVVAFYQAHYRPSNATVVMVGDIDVEHARAWVESASLAPPEERALEQAAPDISFTTPIEAQLPAPFYLTLIGYDLTGADRAVCHALAELVDLRARKALMIERAIAQTVGAECLNLGGHQVLAAVGSSADYSGAEIRDELEGAFREANARAVSADERHHLERRGAVRAARLWGEPRALAGALVDALSGERPGADRRAAIQLALEGPRFDGVAMQQAAKRFLEPSRRVVIHATPF